MSNLFIIVGLGNPGRKYENTRHNLGFITIDQLAEALDIRVSRLKFKSLLGEGRIGTRKVLLVKPQTYMNLSGDAVRQIMDFYKVPVENLLVICDDFDLEVGAIRMRKFGSAGTHNGMRDIVRKLNSDRFPRIRIGMGTGNKEELISFVTGGFQKSEVPILEEHAVCEQYDGYVDQDRRESDRKVEEWYVGGFIFLIRRSIQSTLSR